MNILDRALRQLAPAVALRRVQARKALDLTMNYQAARREGSRYEWRRAGGGGDADTVNGVRGDLAGISRDMIRNTPLARRAQQVIASNVVGDGIIPKIVTRSQAARDEFLGVIESHFDTTAIDADGRQNLYGLQRLALNTIVDAGEVLIRRRRRLRTDGLVLPFQIQILEPDYLNTWVDGETAIGTVIREGIEYNQIGQRVAYHLHDTHPGARPTWASRFDSRRVAASEILHIYWQDRPGQMRGVTWYAAVIRALQNLDDFEDAQLVRQKIAACFTAFRTTNEVGTLGDTLDGDESDVAYGLESLSPGRIQNLPPGEDIRFADPPGVGDYDPFTRGVIRRVAAGFGITYESLSGDLSGVNFSSGRMGRMEMDRNISAWQWLMMVPQMLQPLSAWTLEAWNQASGRVRTGVRLDWVPPHRMLVDPNRELAAMRDEVRSGFTSRSAQIRRLGYDPERVTADIVTDNELADERGLVFDSDPRKVSGAGVTQSEPTASNETEGGRDAQE